jgi:glycosyltransferase involved in cell wall biosynthesis
MRIGIATVHTPPITGGAEFLADGLRAALVRAGHSVHRLIAPFSYRSLDDARRSMDLWESTDFSPYGGGSIDRVIGLKWPAYLMRHPAMAVWLLHQHRPAYDLFGTPHGFSAGDPVAVALRGRIHEADTLALGRLPAVHTISERVCERLRTANGVESSALYHPPARWEDYHCAPAENYILAPSRLEGLKRQGLLIEAMAAVRAPVTAVIVGDGGDRARLERLAADRGVENRVRFLGAVSHDRLIALYARAMAVFFAPKDEDYGYVTLEAMLAGKPVVTCRDSGGPLEFVQDGVTGCIVEPDPAFVAEALDGLCGDPAVARRMGEAGRARYEALDLDWNRVVDTLLAGRAAGAEGGLCA